CTASPRSCTASLRSRARRRELAQRRWDLAPPEEMLRSVPVSVRRSACFAVSSFEGADIGDARLAVAEAQAGARRRTGGAAGEAVGAVVAAQAARGDLELGRCEAAKSLLLETKLLDLLHGSCAFGYRWSTNRRDVESAEYRRRHID